MHWKTIAAATFLVACSGSAPSRGDRAPTDPAATPAYRLHEWGLVSARGASFEVAAGPGLRPPPMELMADKPVLYVLSDERFELDVRVDVPASLEVIEHFPPTELTPLRWVARVGPHCAGSYPGVDDSRCPDGYCEVAELPTYETPDAACLEVGSARAPLLFYRLGSRGVAPSLPLGVEWSGETITVTNTGLREPVGSLWRVTFDGSSVAAIRADVPAVGASVHLARPTEPVGPAREAICDELAQIGLVESERDAFLRAWDAALFGPAPSDGDPGTADEADQPWPADRLSDGLTDDRTALAGPRVPDVLLYWLDAASIARLAAITASPPPRELIRAFLVRVAP